MMNLPAAPGDEFGGYGAPNPPPPSHFPIMDHQESVHREHHHLGYNLEPNSLALLPPSSHATIAAHSPHDILQFYHHQPTSHHYLAGNASPYGGAHFSNNGGFQSYYQQQQQQGAEYYFPTTLVSSAEENMASFAATQLGLNLGYRTYFPPRGGYTYGHHPPRCQAEGCKADLSGAKRYHRRHKVCEHHSKAPVVVTAGGLHQRFCQQCSRFHLLDEFDDAKKSCRKRLADHNRRRRKSKPSEADAAEKRRTQAGKASSTKGKATGSSSKSTGTGDGMDIQVQLGSADLSKDQDETMGLGEVVKEMQVDPKGKASMQQQQQQGHHGTHGLHLQSHHGFPFPSSSAGSCFPQSQAISSTDNTSNIGQVQQEQPGLGFHQQLHQHSNILQLGQAMFDLDFDH
ncbi:hypothetical protein QYE76_046830 [Lolium multiflorum]|uniref:SBP-type domain-containing protein n=1 Tax=Lolium multiflorum TaxID=4521 RepID=A0AAD8WYQ5_LOLMU|nr:squamosa promoter-binding-like protein 8 [Lolium rigidum]KAK1685982.1 hypothetical protein QYE76_046830 [Lolium multiflorum]